MNSDASNEPSKLELTEKLTWALLDNQLSEAGLKDLQNLMRDDPDCLKCYVDCVRLEQDLNCLLRVEDTEAKASPKSRLPGFPKINLTGNRSSAIQSQ